MDTKKQNYFKDKLLEEKSSILDTLDKIHENSDSLKESTEELSTYDNHPADLATETYMMEQNMNLKNNEEWVLKQIDNALTKIKDGTYGQCEICGNNISEGRLETIPYAQSCMDCKEDQLSLNDIVNYRPVEEESLGYPFGRTFKDISEEDFVGTDGEDIYQSIARFNEQTGDPSFNGGDNLGVYDEQDAGVVEDIDQISEGYYKSQWEGIQREDIPEEQMIEKNEE